MDIRKKEIRTPIRKENFMTMQKRGKLVIGSVRSNYCCRIMGDIGIAHKKKDSCVKFWLEPFRIEIRVVVAALFLPLLMSVTVQGAFEDSVHMYAHDQGGNLYTVDLQTREARLVGQTALVFWDIAFSAEGELYGIDFSSYYKSTVLYQIDPTTADSLWIGPIGLGGGWNSLVFDEDGTLWAAGAGSIATIDTDSGAGTIFTTFDIFSLGVAAGDLAFSKDGDLYLTTTKGLLVRIDTADGTVEEIGDLGYNDIRMLGRGPDGQMYGITSDNQLLQIDLTTGTADKLGDLSAEDFELKESHGGSFTTEAVRSLLFVDDDALNDPGPYDLTISDPRENGTKDHPYDSIQEAIEKASNGSTVIVLYGTYVEALDLLEKSLKITSAEPNQPDDVTFPVIDANNQGPAVTFAGSQEADCVLRGFILTCGQGAIDCLGSSPCISNCVIAGNRRSDPNHGVIHCVDSNAVFENCTIVGNYSGYNSAAFHFVSSAPYLSNCIVWNNLPEEFACDAKSLPQVKFSNTTVLWPDEGNIEAEPRFAFPGYWTNLINSTKPLDPDDPAAIWIPGDYHLMSCAGRWDPRNTEWITDDVKSPCIDAGNPGSPWEMEPQFNGDRINMGAYGGTSQASKSGP